MKPEVRFGIIVAIIFVLMFLFARFIAPSIKKGIETAVLGEGYAFLESDKFRIHYPSDIYSQEEIVTLDTQLTLFTQDFQAQMKKNAVQIKDFEKCTIYLLRSHDKLRDFGMQMEVADMSNNGGYFSPSTFSIAVIGADHEVLKHEAVHLLLTSSKSLTNNEIKPWMDEAFAQYYEKYPDKPQLVAVQNLPTINEIVNFDRGDFSKPDNPKYYKSSLYLLTFLLRSTETSKIVYKNLQSSMKNSSDSVLSDLENKGLEQLDVEFRNWYMNIK